MGMLNDGTAIGDGLATSINRIKEGKAKSKSIILITDGTNNTGVVAPMTAAEIAKKDGYKGIYHRCRSKRHSTHTSAKLLRRHRLCADACSH